MIKALTIFSGNANRELAEAICRCVEVRIGAAEVTNFSDGEIFVEIGENVRGVNCFVVQPTSAPVNNNIMELLVMIDALKRASAGSIVAVMPSWPATARRSDCPSWAMRRRSLRSTASRRSSAPGSPRGRASTTRPRRARCGRPWSVAGSRSCSASATKDS